MIDGKITLDMKVWEVVSRYPQAAQVFLGRGCPDMRKGLFSFMARIMSVKRAAWIHKIPADELIRELNTTIKPQLGS